MAMISVSPWAESIPGTLLYAWPLINLPLTQPNWEANRVFLPEATSGGYWPISLNDSISRFWVLFAGSTLPTGINSALAVIDLENLITPLPDNLTVAVPQVLQDAGFDPTNIIRYRGTTWAILFESLGALTDVDEIWFTLRRRQSDEDSKSLVQISSTNGMLYSNGAVATSGNASISIEDSLTGDVLVTVKAVETTKYPVTDNLNYDIKVLRNNGDIDLIHNSSRFRISGDITRRITGT
jgi:hypothetical protein